MGLYDVIQFLYLVASHDFLACEGQHKSYLYPGVGNHDWHLQSTLAGLDFNSSGQFHSFGCLILRFNQVVLVDRILTFNSGIILFLTQVVHWP